MSTVNINGNEDVILSGSMFGRESINPLGTEKEESSAHEMTEPKGPSGEDID